MKKYKMPESNASAGYLRSGVPYNRTGHGPRPLVVFGGLFFENKPMPGLIASSFYKALWEDYTIYTLTRKPRLPKDYTLKDMSDDYAAAIREEFETPVDLIGVSTGGSIAQHFAADHADLVRKLALHSAAYSLSEKAKALQRHVAELACQRGGRAAFAAMIIGSLPKEGMMRYLGTPFAWLGATMMVGLPFTGRKNPSDFVVTVEAEDKHDFKNRLCEITMPTLVVGGDKDPFYSEALFRETAEGIPNARLLLYQGKGHTPGGKDFDREIVAFFREASA